MWLNLVALSLICFFILVLPNVCVLFCDQMKWCMGRAAHFSSVSSTTKAGTFFRFHLGMDVVLQTGREANWLNYTFHDFQQLFYYTLGQSSPFLLLYSPVKESYDHLQKQR